MKEKIKLYGSILILLIFVPYLVTVYLHGGNFGFSFGNSKDDQIEEQLVGILAKEMPATYETECLKAQAVIARTNLYRELEAVGDDAQQEKEAVGDGQSESVSGQPEGGAESSQSERGSNQPESSVAPDGWTKADMSAAWGEKYEQYLEKIENAIAQTEGEVLTYNGELIQAAYHTASNKKTRNASEVPGQEAYSWLVSAESKEDILADGFLYIGYMEKQQFADAIQGVFQDETITADQLPGALDITERDSADYVTKVTYGNTVVNGEAIRDALGLNSACFYFSELEGKIRIVTKGIGHGLGFSQYGANELAKQGQKYRELLEYYYKGVEIERID